MHMIYSKIKVPINGQHHSLTVLPLVLISVCMPLSCRHSSVMWVISHNFPTYCRYLLGI